LEIASEGIGNIAEVAVGIRQNQITTELQDELMERQETTLNELESTDLNANLSPGEVSSIEEFAQYMTDLQTAAEQRSRSITDLKIAQERKLREYMARYPQLTDRLQQAATGVLGYQPLGARMRAAEAAERGGGGGNMPQVLQMFMQQAKEQGVPMDLYFSNPKRFYSMAQQAVHKNFQTKQLAAEIELVGHQMGIAGLVQTGQFNHFMTTIAPKAWNEDIAPVMDDYYNALGITDGMGAAEKADRIRAAQGSGLFMQMQARLAQKKAEFTAAAYANYYERFKVGVDTSMGPAALAPLSPEQFEKQLAPVLAQYDWALGNLTQANAMDHVKGLNQLVDDGIIAGMPQNVRAAAAYGKLFGEGNTYAAVLLQGEAGTIATQVIHAAMIPAMTGRTRVGEPRAAPLVDPNSGAVQPENLTRNQGRVFNFQELLSRMQTDNPGDGNRVYEEMVTQYVAPWLKGIQSAESQEDALLYATASFAALQGYANMVVEAELTGTERPSEDTDMRFVNTLASPDFAEAVRLARSSGRFPAMNEIMSNWIDIMRGLGQESFLKTETRVIELLTDPMQGAPTRDAYGLPQQFSPGPDFVRDTFASYVDMRVDPTNYTVTFSVKPGAPDYNRLTDLVVDQLNDMPPKDLQDMAMIAVAVAHANGQTSQRAYNMMFKTLLGL
jgi:hypothetical protein